MGRYSQTLWICETKGNPIQNTGLNRALINFVNEIELASPFNFNSLSFCLQIHLIEDTLSQVLTPYEGLI